jgi:3-hydroxyisobutyrate dehydrogenase-like beta-hydroxyacid dehydrogenase
VKTTQTQPDVAVIGLGNMGSALADRLIAKGFTVTVWNRSQARTRPYVDSGIAVAATVAEAVEAAEVIVVCLLDHEATMAMVATDAVAPALKGKTLVELTTMTADKSRTLGAWADAHGIAYLEGQIQDFPETVRDGESTIICSGPTASYEAGRNVFDALSARAFHVSQNLGSAPTLVNAQLAFTYMTYVGILHGAAMCQAAGVSVDTFRDVMLLDYMRSAPFLKDVDDLVRKAQGRNFDESVGATVEVWQASLQSIVGENMQAGLETDHLKTINALMERAREAGHSEHDFAALIDTIKPRN